MKPVEVNLMARIEWLTKAAAINLNQICQHLLLELQLWHDNSDISRSRIFWDKLNSDSESDLASQNTLQKHTCQWLPVTRIWNALTVTLGRAFPRWLVSSIERLMRTARHVDVPMNPYRPYQLSQQGFNIPKLESLTNPKYHLSNVFANTSRNSSPSSNCEWIFCSVASNFQYLLLRSAQVLLDLY